MFDYFGIKTRTVSDLNEIFGLYEFFELGTGCASVLKTIKSEKNSYLERADLCINEERFGSMYFAGVYFEAKNIEQAKNSLNNFSEFIHSIEKNREFVGIISTLSAEKIVASITDNLFVDQDDFVLWHVNDQEEFYLEDIYIPCLVGIDINSEKLMRLLAENGYNFIISFPDIIKHMVYSAFDIICEDFDCVCALYPEAFKNAQSNLYERIICSSLENLVSKYKFSMADDNSGIYTRYISRSIRSFSAAIDEIQSSENSAEKTSRYVLVKDNMKDCFFIFVNYDVDGQDLWDYIVQHSDRFDVEGVFDTADKASEAYKNNSNFIYCVILSSVKDLDENLGEFEIRAVRDAMEDTLIPEKTACLYDSYFDACEKCNALNNALLLE